MKLDQVIENVRSAELLYNRIEFTYSIRVKANAAAPERQERMPFHGDAVRKSGRLVYQGQLFCIDRQDD
jgi:hypothetical protein